MHYRREIDGLRAVAVVPVILFHAGVGAFAGGFVGVDVFFVISGYLITTLILAERAAGTFALADFYERRARRILPALFVVMAACVGLAWLHLLPAEMKSFGQGTAAAAAFVANLFFLVKRDDYFGMQSDGNPLLHLWSLSVEEQYYLLFPVFLLLAWKLGRARLALLLAGVAATSLAAAQWMSAHAPMAAFFLLPTRGWELLLGALVAFHRFGREDFPRRRALDEVLAATGLALTAWAVFAFDERVPFPSLYALVPTLGAALVIGFATAQTLVGRLLGSRLAVGIGLISYSAYLWHQPLFAFNRVLGDGAPGRASFLALALLALVLAWLTWRFVEQPFRARQRIGRRALAVSATAAAAAFVAFGVVGHLNSGYPERNPLFARLVANFGLAPGCNGNHAITAACATTAAPEIAVWGNSYAMHLVEGLVAAYPDRGVVQLTQDSCAANPEFALQKLGKLDCREFNRRALATILGSPSITRVLVSSRFDDLADARNVAPFEQALRRIAAAGKQVTIVGPTPSNGVDFGKCFVRHGADFASCDFARRSIDRRHGEIVARLKEIAARSGAGFVDLTDAICAGALCRASVGGTLIYRDGGHLSREGSRYLFLDLRRIGALRL